MIGYKPLSITVGSTSTAVVPPVRPKSADILTWTGSTAYTVGQIVTNNSILYWCVGAGTSAATGGPTHTDGDATDGTATWRYLRPVRNLLTLVNDSDEAIYVATGGAAAVMNKGIRLNAAGGMFSWDGADVPQGWVYAICSSGSKVLTVQEG